jgi:hypothetical protein
VADRDDLPQAQTLDDRFKVAKLLFKAISGVGRFVRSTKARKSNVTTRRPLATRYGIRSSQMCRLSGKPCMSTKAGPAPA